MTTTKMLIYRGKLVSKPAALPRFLLREMIHGPAVDDRPMSGNDEWHRMSPAERLEWLAEKCWVLPPEERWAAMERSRTKLVGLIKERAWATAAAKCTPGHA